VIWITEHFPEEKIAVWIANFHGVKEISQALYPADSLFYFIQQCAGEGIYHKLRDKFYSLAITSVNYIDYKGVELKQGLLEASIAKKTENAPYAFVDFVPLRYADGFREKEFDAALIGKKRAKWLNMFDGVFVIRDQYLKKDYLERLK
jgi:hypothetical protein